MWNSMRDQWLSVVTGPRNSRRAVRRHSGLIEDLEDRRLLSAANTSAAEVSRSVAKETTHVFWFNLGDVEVTEGNSGTKTVTLRIFASPAAKKPITIEGEFTTNGSGQGFASESDFVAAPFTATIPKGATSTTVQATIVGDLLPEMDETFVATITKATGAVIDNANQVVTIKDDDTVVNPELPNVSFNANNVVVAGEGESQFFTLKLDQVSGSDVTVTILLAGTSGVPSASIPSDVQFEGGDDELIVTIPAGTLTKDFEVLIIDDELAESTEGYTVSIASAVGANVIAPLSNAGNILDDDSPPTVSIDADAFELEGDSELTDVPVNITLSEPVENDVVVHYAIEMNLEAGKKQRAKKKDFVVTTGSVTIPAGETTAEIIAQIVGDAKKEEDETFLVRLTGATGAAVSSTENISVVTIENDDGVSAPARLRKGKQLTQQHARRTS